MIIIAIFYSQELATNSLIVASIGLVVLFIFNRLELENKTPFILVSIIVWAAVLKSGVHATLAGFAVAWQALSPVLYVPLVNGSASNGRS